MFELKIKNVLKKEPKNVIVRFKESPTLVHMKGYVRETCIKFHSISQSYIKFHSRLPISGTNHQFFFIKNKDEKPTHTLISIISNYQFHTIYILYLKPTLNESL